MSDWAITYSKDEATERQVLPFPHKPSPEEVAEHLLEWVKANPKPGRYSTGKLESDEPAKLLLRRFGIVVTGIVEARSLPRPAGVGRFRRYAPAPPSLRACQPHT